MLDPSRVVREVDEGAERLEKAADVFSASVKRFEDAEQDFELAMAIERKKAYFDTDTRTKKPPAEDVRDAMALASVDEGIRLEYAAAKAEKESQKTRFYALQGAVSARQSLLKYLTA